MTLAAAEDWLKAVCADELGTGVTVTTGPGTWDGSYLKKLLTDLPAVIITWDGGAASRSTSLTLDTTWMLYVVTGWQGKDEEFRRRGDAATKGAYMILTMLASRLHNASMGEVQRSARGAIIPGAGIIDGFGLLQVVDIANEWSGSWERTGVAVYALEIGQNTPLEGVDAEGFDDWLKTNMTLDIPEGAGIRSRHG